MDEEKAWVAKTCAKTLGQFLYFDRSQSTELRQDLQLTIDSTYSFPTKGTGTVFIAVLDTDKASAGTWIGSIHVKAEGKVSHLSVVEDYEARGVGIALLDRAERMINSSYISLATGWHPTDDRLGSQWYKDAGFVETENGTWDLGGREGAAITCFKKKIVLDKNRNLFS